MSNDKTTVDTEQASDVICPHGRKAGAPCWGCHVAAKRPTPEQPIVSAAQDLGAEPKVTQCGAAAQWSAHKPGSDADLLAWGQHLAATAKSVTGADLARLSGRRCLVLWVEEASCE